ncbi:DUF6339 family protein [Catellatospora coxensis]|uniref:Uncharacterized protein n=1 Tax=Catellatospora coxensis TaxID=310354 RepID=A0A8J3L3X5_9ACTN|nr:DUF6339 family protein [Catellatospora coxensis]GIG06105.1 hypothetical protein Cco03nite_28050 [Catellatospora coxensis]
MDLLYPRLLPANARMIHAELEQVSVSDLGGHYNLEHVATVFTATGGDRVSKRVLGDLRTELVTAARENGFPHPPSVQQRLSFDSRVGPALHSLMDMVPSEAAAGDIWAFMALVLAPDVAYWRFRRPDEKFDSDHVLGSDVTRHVFARLWWRAHLLHDPAAGQPYASFDVVGGAAFDQIFARRRALGASPVLVKAIVRVWASVDTHGGNERRLLQDFLMRLLRLAPFVAFESLTPSQLDIELQRVARDTISAVRT